MLPLIPPLRKNIGVSYLLSATEIQASTSPTCFSHQNIMDMVV